MMTFGEKVLIFYRQLSVGIRLPKGVAVLNPYQQDKAFGLCQAFYQKYYGDQGGRKIILGINPGRFGAGLTGIPFTDPVKLDALCGIENDLPKKTELSADFMYEMMATFGGHEKFYRTFFINSVCPLGFTEDGKNLNYYDRPSLTALLEKFMIRSIRQQLAFGINTEKAFCLGEGANFKYLTRLNESEKFFKKIVPLAHPRFIMQYKRKEKGKYIADYLAKLR